MKTFDDVLEESRSHQKTITSEKEYKQAKKYILILKRNFLHHELNHDFGNLHNPYDIQRFYWKAEIRAKREAIASYCHNNLLDHSKTKKERIKTAWNEYGRFYRKKNRFVGSLQFECSKGYVLEVVNATEQDKEVEHRNPIPSEIREKVENRDENSCVNCNVSENLNYHHIKPKSNGGKDIASNIALLCDDCHDKVHRSDIYRNYKLKDSKESFWRWVYSDRNQIQNDSFREQTAETLHKLVASELEYLKQRFNVPKEFERFVESEKKDFSNLDDETRRKYEIWADEILGE